MNQYPRLSRRSIPMGSLFPAKLSSVSRFVMKTPGRSIQRAPCGLFSFQDQGRVRPEKRKVRRPALLLPPAHRPRQAGPSTQSVRIEGGEHHENRRVLRLRRDFPPPRGCYALFYCASFSSEKSLTCRSYLSRWYCVTLSKT